MKSNQLTPKTVFHSFMSKGGIWLLLFLCVIGFVALAEDVFHQEMMEGDIIGYRLLSKYLISDAVTPIAKWITNFSGVPILLFLTAVLVVFLQEKKQKLFVPLNLLLVTLFNLLLKQIVQRPRPTEFRLIEENGYSFPSGHSMVSMAFYGYLIYLTYRNIHHKGLKWSIMVLLSLLILAIGISRIYLGVHYTSDVLAGFLISFSYLILFIKVTNKITGTKERHDEKE